MTGLPSTSLGSKTIHPSKDLRRSEARQNSYEDGRLKTVWMKYEGDTYDDFNDPEADKNYAKSLLTGWRKAEKCIIASSLAMTNLVVHVKDLHLELAATFQAVTVDAFSGNFDHAVSRMMQPYSSQIMPSYQR